MFLVTVAVAIAICMVRAEARKSPTPQQDIVEVYADGAIQQERSDPTVPVSAEAPKAARLMRREDLPETPYPNSNFGIQESTAASAPTNRSMFHTKWGDGSNLAALIKQEVEITSTHQASSATVEGIGKSNVLYVVYSDSLFYDNRLKWVIDTWAKGVPRSSFVVIGDTVPENFSAIVHKTRCPPHSHEEGACCKYAEAVVLAHKLMQGNPTFQWAYFTDDDAYVRTDALEQALMRQPGDAEGNGVVLGTFGCAGQSCRNGLCAGGGYGANVRAVERLMEESPSVLLQEQMENCARCGRWADVAMSQIFQNRKIEQRPLPGLNGFIRDKCDFDKSLVANEPLMYHYVRSWQQMEFLERLFLPQARTQAIVGEDKSAQCASYHGNVQCAKSTSSQDRPWTDTAIEVLRNCQTT